MLFAALNTIYSTLEIVPIKYITAVAIKSKTISKYHQNVSVNKYSTLTASCFFYPKQSFVGQLDIMNQTLVYWDFRTDYLICTCPRVILWSALCFYDEWTLNLQQMKQTTSKARLFYSLFPHAKTLPNMAVKGKASFAKWRRTLSFYPLLLFFSVSSVKWIRSSISMWRPCDIFTLYQVSLPAEF